MPKYEITFSPSRVKRVGFYTFGCMLNQSETAAITQSFADYGYEVVDFDSEADLSIS